MKKLFYSMLIFLMFLFILSSCGTEPSEIELKIKSYDFYTEIVAFDDLFNRNIRLFVTYNGNSTDVTYIYLMENVQADYELIFKIGTDQIIYEDFIVLAYDEGKNFMGSFTGESIGLDNDITKVSMWLMRPGIHWSEYPDSSILYQEFNLIKSTDDLTTLNRNFISTEQFTLSGVNIINDDIIQRRTTTSFILVISISIVLYAFGLKVYKQIYEVGLNKALIEGNKKIKLMDIQAFKYISAIALVILAIIGQTVAVVIIQADYNKSDFYSKYDANYENIDSDEINLMYGGTYQFDYNVAFVEKDDTHRVMGTLYIELDDGMTTIVSSNSFGGYEFKIFYKFITSKYMNVQVNEWFDTNSAPEQKTIFSRTLYFDDFSDGGSA